MLVDMQKKLNLSLIILAISVLLALLDGNQGILISILLGIVVIAASSACFFFQKKILHN